MSSIQFHFPPDGYTLQVSGSERAHFGILAEDFAKGLIGVMPGIIASNLGDRLGPFVNPEGPLAGIPSGTKGWDEALAYGVTAMSFRTGQAVFAWKGQEIQMSSLIWNTVLAAGSDPLRLGVKIHCTCEHYGYFMGFHRRWFADLIDEGLEEGLFRKGYFRNRNPLHDLARMSGQVVPEAAQEVFVSQGWVELAARLREENQGPVVMSFSGSDSFPNSTIGSWMPPWPDGVPRRWDELTEAQQKERASRSEDWDYQSFEKQWSLSVKGLKAQTWNKPIDPKTLRPWRFGHEISLLDLMNQDVERIEKGLRIP
jgi:hypothetical protein